MNANARGEQDGAEQCLHAVFVRQRPQLQRLVAGMGLSAADGEDVLQDVFVAAMERPGEFRGGPDAERWLFRVTVNRCLLEYRRRQRFRRAAREIIARRRADRHTEPAAADALLHEEELEMVRKTLQDLDGPSAVALALRYMCGLDATQIGAILDVPPATVRSRLHTARLRLAENLTRQGITT